MDVYRVKEKREICQSTVVLKHIPQVVYEVSFWDGGKFWVSRETFEGLEVGKRYGLSFAEVKHEGEPD